jgi:uncharacterized protein (DUF1800 family)
MSRSQQPYPQGDGPWRGDDTRPIGRLGADEWGGAQTGPHDATEILPSGYGGYASLPPPQLPQPTQPPKRGVSRRAILVGAGAGALGIGALGAGVGLLLSKHAAGNTGPVNLAAGDAGQVAHLLRRAGFGLAPWDAAEYVNAGVSGATDMLLNYASVADDVEARIQGYNLNLTKSADVVREFMLRALYSKRPLETKMTLFWHGVLTSSLTKIGGSQYYPLLPQQGELLRQKAMGKFDDLIRAITTDPAMLWWLDGRFNTGSKPNENYARELMELFTMGIVDAAGQPTYTQDDVHQGALALSGWTLLRGANQAIFRPTQHYSGSVNFLGHSGPMTVNDVVKIVCAHPATARHIAWRMWNFFVYELDGRTIPTPQGLSDPVLQPLVDAYNNHDHSIAAMVKAMLTSPAFYGTKAYRSRVKSPIEFVAGVLRGLGVDYDAKTVAATMAALGQVPYAPPDVSGWDGDKVSAAWVSTQTWMTRCNFVNALVAAVAGGKGSVAGSPIQGIITNQQLATPAAVADYFVAALVDNQLPDDRRAILHEAITASASGPAFALHGGGTLPAASLRNTLYLLMSMPEYQMN